MEEEVRRPSLECLRAGRRPAWVRLLDGGQQAGIRRQTHRPPEHQSNREGDMKAIIDHAPAGLVEGGAGSRHWATWINSVLVPLVEVPAALLVVAEIVVLFA